MKKWTLLVLLLMLTFVVDNCKKGAPDHETATTANSGEKRAKNGDGESKIDVDKLDLPDRVKQAIKEGKIPPDRLKTMIESMQSNAPAVKIEPVAKKSIKAYLILNGVVEPERTVEIYSRLSAYIKTIQKEEGDFVTRNETLALLDDSEIRISHQQAKIELEQAEVTFRDQEKNHARNKELMDSKLISEKDFLTSEVTLRKAQLDFENRRENFKNLELQLNYTKISSPIEGFITERLTEVGDKVTVNQQVFTVEDFTPLLIKIFVPTSDIVNLKTAMPAQISTDIVKGDRFDGKIKLINPRIDVQSGTVKVTVEVFDESHRLKPGMFVEVKIMVRNQPDALVIPKKSITYKQDEIFVFVFHEMKVNKRMIQTGISEEDTIEVIEGLKEGEMIVTVGVETLKDQMKVKVLQ